MIYSGGVKFMKKSLPLYENLWHRCPLAVASNLDPQVPLGAAPQGKQSFSLRGRLPPLLVKERVAIISEI
jgi:hypothetical protein